MHGIWKRSLYTCYAIFRYHRQNIKTPKLPRHRLPTTPQNYARPIGIHLSLTCLFPALRSRSPLLVFRKHNRCFATAPSLLDSAFAGGFRAASRLSTVLINFHLLYIVSLVILYHWNTRNLPSVCFNAATGTTLLSSEGPAKIVRASPCSIANKIWSYPPQLLARPWQHPPWLAWALAVKLVPEALQKALRFAHSQRARKLCSSALSYLPSWYLL